MISKIEINAGNRETQSDSGNRPHRLSIVQHNEHVTNDCEDDHTAQFDNGGGPTKFDRFVALKVLNDAFKFAHNCGKSPWEFAIEINELLDRGVSRSLMRWLVCQNLAEHRIESQKCNDVRRQFCEAPNLVFNEFTCFVITQDGVAAFAELDAMNLQNPKPQELTSDSEQPSISPVWCPETRVLKINGKVVKHFKWPAPNQEKLIAAFAEENWPKHLADPLPPNHVCPKRRLHDTIKCLNRNQINKLVKFRGDGTGQGVFWEYRPPTPE